VGATSCPANANADCGGDVQMVISGATCIDEPRVGNRRRDIHRGAMAGPGELSIGVPRVLIMNG
jgi:hypothetical protein